MSTNPNQPRHNSTRPGANIPPSSELAEPFPMDRSYVPPRDEVAKRAYYIFLNQGGYNGFDLDHWLEAELQLVAEHNAALKNARSHPANK